MVIEFVKCFRIDHEKGITLANRSVEVRSAANSCINFSVDYNGEVIATILRKDFFLLVLNDSRASSLLLIIQSI